MFDLFRLNDLGEALRDATITFKTNTALIEANREKEKERWTYTQVQNEAERVASLLQQNGFRPGDRCSILMTNQSRWPISALGVFWAGGVLVPLDYKLTAKEQMALFRHSQSSVLITEWPIWQAIQEEAEKVGEKFANKLILVTEAPANTNLKDATRWETTTEGTVKIIHRNRDDIACIVYSSGTGGTPKGCMLTHANYLAQAEQLSQLYPSSEEYRFFSILPTNHAIDFMLGFVYQFLYGATVIHQRSLRPEFLAWTMKEYRPTHMALVPMLLKTIEKKMRTKIDELPPWKKMVLDGLLWTNDMATQRRPNPKLSQLLLQPLHEALGGKLQLVVSGGAFVEPATADFFYSIGIPVAIGYGLTEAGTAITVNDLKPFRSDTVGPPLEGNQIQIRDKNDEGIGEVWVKGPTVMKGYLDEPTLTQETIVEGWLRTGDLGYVDPAGHVRLFGRRKNMIVTEGGKNIYPEDIESTFEDLEECEEYCVFASNYVWPTQTITGEKLIMVLRPKDQADKLSPTLEKALQEKNRSLPDFKRVSGYVVWPKHFPRTASLKVKRDPLASEMRSAFNAPDVVQEL